MSKVSIPVYYIRGALADARQVNSDVRVLKNGKSFRQAIVPNSGQYPYETEFTRFNTEILAFIVNYCTDKSKLQAPASESAALNGGDLATADDDHDSYGSGEFIGSM